MSERIAAGRFRCQFPVAGSEGRSSRPASRRQGALDTAQTSKWPLGRTTCDFGDVPLANIAQSLSNFRPDDAIALAKLNLEHYPESIDTRSEI